MMKKTIKTGKVKAEKLEAKEETPPVPPPPPRTAQNWDFPINGQFRLNNTRYIIRKARREDNTDWRLVWVDGEEQWVMLETVRRDALKGDFEIYQG